MGLDANVFLTMKGADGWGVLRGWDVNGDLGIEKGEVKEGWKGGETGKRFGGGMRNGHC